jgi:hypothetical protein
MKNVVAGKCADEEMVSRICPDVLLEWLLPKRPYLEGRGVCLTPEVDCGKLAEVLREPTPDMPADLLEGLHAFRGLDNEDGMGGDGNLFVVDEHAERLWLPQRHAEAIRAMVGRHQTGGRALEVGDLRRIVAGTDVFSRQSHGTTIAAQYAREGIPLKPASMDRVNGWAEVLQRVGDVGAGVRARMFIHQRCGRLAETLPAMQHDPNRPEDVLKVDADEDGVGGDDAADALRYLVATKSRTVAQRKLRGL